MATFGGRSNYDGSQVKRYKKQQSSDAVFLQVQVKSRVFAVRHPVCLQLCITISKESKHLLCYYNSFIY